MEGDDEPQKNSNKNKRKDETKDDGETSDKFDEILEGLFFSSFLFARAPTSAFARLRVKGRKMPLGERQGDKSESRYCGVETEFSDDMPQLLGYNIKGGFDFVVAPLIDPSYRPSLTSKSNNECGTLPVACSDLVLSPSQWGSRVVGKISSWIDLDAEDELLRRDSETTLKQELAWAAHLSIQACLLPSPKGCSYANYARCVNQILQGSQNMQLWLRIPLKKWDKGDTDDDSVQAKGQFDSWETWNNFRLLCDHHSQLSIALDILGLLPSENSLGRWFGEPLPEQERYEIAYRASLEAAEDSGRKLNIYAVEKNPNAVVTLNSLVKLEGWEDNVTIVSCDMRCWDAPEKADILVSELLGCFGDNELSPESL